MAKDNYKTKEMNSQTSTDKEEGIKEKSKIELIYRTGFSYLQSIYVVVTSLIFQSDYMTVLQKKSCLMVKSKEKQSVIKYADIQSVKAKHYINRLNVVTGLALLILSIGADKILYGCILLAFFIWLAIANALEIKMKDGNEVLYLTNKWDDVNKASVMIQSLSAVQEELDNTENQVNKKSDLGHTVKMVLKKNTLYIIALACVIFVSYSIHISTTRDYLINDVKEGYFPDYGTKSIGIGFDQYFDNPDWKSFKSDKGVQTVEFTGKCAYDGNVVTITVQFAFNEDDTFYISWMDMDGSPVDSLTQMSLLETVLNESYESDESIESNEMDKINNSSEVYGNSDNREQNEEMNQETNQETMENDEVSSNINRIWQGYYQTGSDEDSGTLDILQVDENSFVFNIEAVSGDNVGEIEWQVANIHSDGVTAIFEDEDGFRLYFYWDNNTISVMEDGYNSYAGMNVTFDGTYMNTDALGVS